ncbi:MAG: hypothetical protein EXS17_07660 [Phycisphaerales bacterium]|nr:hypothetical protein [Phycisphaerales bacterium]
MSPGLAVARNEAHAASAVIGDDETILLMIRPSPWFIVTTSLRAFPPALAAGTALAIATLDRSIPWDVRGAVLASVAIILARAAWQTVDWIVRLYVLTDRRIVVRRGPIPEVSVCLLNEVAGVGQPRRMLERATRTGSLAILRGPSRRARRARRERRREPQSETKHKRVRVEHSMEWSVVADAPQVRRTILLAVSRYS